VATDTWFRAAAADGPDWGEVAKSCLDRLGPVPGANLGFLYLTDRLASHAAGIVTLLRGVTGIRDWVGTTGLGISAVDEETFDRPAMAILAAHLPAGSFRVFAPVRGDAGAFAREAAAFAAKAGPGLAIVHADPRVPDLAAVLGEMAEAAGFLVGGLTASRGAMVQLGAPPGGDPAAERAVTGVLLGRDAPVVVGLTQGCSPIGPVRTVTRAEGPVIAEIDGRPALEVFKEDIGELLARDLRRVAGYVFAALPVAGSDTGDYLVRNLVAIDPGQGLIAIAEPVDPGRRILFTRRDHDAAAADMDRMLADLKRRLPSPPKAALYVSCVARGPNLFGPGSEELRTIRRWLGDVPVVGFFANGEVSNDRLYAYTGVLTLFL
jgi:small ligand-binding sensory domain FIST